MDEKGDKIKEQPEEPLSAFSPLTGPFPEAAPPAVQRSPEGGESEARMLFPDGIEFSAPPDARLSREEAAKLEADGQLLDLLILEKLETISATRIWHDQLTELEQWAKANRKDARNDALAFWALKAPAIIASASAGIWAHFNLTTISVIAGAVASVCVIVDGIHPRGMLRNTHLRAFHDLRILTSRMTAQLRSSEGRTDRTVKRIIREAEPERERIAAYIRDAETALKPTDIK